MSNTSTFYVAPGTGTVSSRSDWSKDATQVLFKVGPVRESHDDRAIGEFLMFRGSWLAGETKLASHSGISGDAVNHNCLTVDGKAQSWTEDQASLLLQEDTPTYTYLKGDCAPAYLGQLSTYTRELLFVKPNYLLVRDAFTPILPTSQVVWHLHTLTAPAIAGEPFSAGYLYGRVIAPAGGSASVVTVQNDPLDTKSYRLDLMADGSDEFLVALEAGSPTQGVSTITKVQNAKGAILGSSFATWLSGPGPWSYTSPISGPHILVGLKPNTLYTVAAPSGGTTVTSSATGVLSWSSLTSAGTPITITEGQPAPLPPAPAPPVPVVTGKKYAYTMVNGTLTLTEVGS